MMNNPAEDRSENLLPLCDRYVHEVDGDGQYWMAYLVVNVTLWSIAKNLSPRPEELVIRKFETSYFASDPYENFPLNVLCHWNNRLGILSDIHERKNTYCMILPQRRQEHIIFHWHSSS